LFPDDRPLGEPSGILPIRRPARRRFQPV